MNRLPRAVIGLGAGAVIAVPSLFLVEQAFEGPSYTDQVLNCARHLGNEAVASTLAGKATAQDCAPYMAGFAVVKKGEALTYTLPVADAFVLKETPIAKAKDETNTNRKRFSEGAAIVAGWVTSIVVFDAMAGAKAIKFRGRRSARSKAVPSGGSN